MTSLLVSVFLGTYLGLLLWPSALTGPKDLAYMQYVQRESSHVIFLGMSEMEYG